MQLEIEKALIRGIDWLIAQQAEDGGWHSKTYGQLKDGAGVTALILDALGHLPQPLTGKKAIAARKAFGFLDGGLKKRGTIASPDGSLDFPTYAAALWLTAANRLAPPPPDHRASQAKLVEYLVAAQVAEPRGFAADSPSYGGWDFLGPADAQGITTGTNISVTRHVIDALSLARAGRVNETADRAVDKAIEMGRAYVLRCQQADGGFAFTCEPASLNNKAAYSDSDLRSPRSYGSATCDGVRALVACGVKPDDAQLTKAIAWLAKRPGLELVPGFEGLPPEAGWDRGLRFYYYATLSRALALLPLSERAARRAALQKHIIGLQMDDGMWVNESDRMRENDPLIATALAISALAAA